LEATVNHVLTLRSLLNLTAFVENNYPEPQHTSNVTAISVLLAAKMRPETQPIQPSLLPQRWPASETGTSRPKKTHQKADISARLCSLFNEPLTSKSIGKWLGITKGVPESELEYLLTKLQNLTETETTLHPKQWFIGKIRKYLFESGKISKEVYDRRRGSFERKGDEKTS
jgi:hypothetical protein